MGIGCGNGGGDQLKANPHAASNGWSTFDPSAASTGIYDDKPAALGIRGLRDGSTAYVWWRPESA